MILQQTRSCGRITTCLHCCHGNIHSTPISLQPRKQAGEWQKHAENAKKKVNDWLSANNSFKNTQTFKNVKPEEGDKNRPKPSDAYPNQFLSYFPTTAKFNSYFDRAFSKFPSGMDLINKAPLKYHPYLLLSRVDKPIGSWLLYLPGAWGICMAAQTFHPPSIPLLFLFGTGTVVFS